MALKKSTNGQWKIDVRIDGVRHRKTFQTKREAEFFISRMNNRIRTSALGYKARDPRKCSDLADTWYKVAGVFLRDGERRYRVLLTIFSQINNPAGQGLTASDIANHFAIRHKKGISPKTLNNHLGYLNAMFNRLIEIDEIEYPNPLAKLKPIKIPENELAFLTRSEISILLNTIASGTENPHVHLLTRICLSTGARWGEAQSLTLRNLRNGQLTFVKTKSGKTRSVPVNKVLFSEIQEHLKTHKRFSNSLSAFRRALDRSGIELPAGQAAHALRHSFASHFIMNGGNVVTLQRILGHANITVTMRYAHLSPDHLREAIELNPLQKQARKTTAELPDFSHSIQ
ncbi:phage integrase [Oceanobacter kriegii]|uniref:phage integrase n=1 Tax=Oceanobacter kriegii TaxID=64972 RepID=UPI0003FC0060|nr:tyrosine-type recombinase/integrase [Oceanobacter kriegii]